jgi:integrase
MCKLNNLQGGICVKNSFEDMYVLKTGLSKEDFLDQVYSKSNSLDSKKIAKNSLNQFEKFCLSKFNLSSEKVIDGLRSVNGEQKYYLMQDFINYLNNRGVNPATAKLYFGWIKRYLRKAKGIKLEQDDIHDLITFRKQIKEPRVAVTKDEIKILLDNVSERRKSLYLTLLSSGMRIGETLQLRKCDFDFESDPVKITIPGRFTKTKEQRETFIAREAKEILLRRVKDLNPVDRVFSNLGENAVEAEDIRFHELRQRCGLTRKYQESNRHVITIHSFRAYFITKATQIINGDYAHALAGHHAYLAQYSRLTPEEQTELYRKLEPHLLIYSDSELANSQREVLNRQEDENKRIWQVLNAILEKHPEIANEWTNRYSSL